MVFISPGCPWVRVPTRLGQIQLDGPQKTIQNLLSCLWHQHSAGFSASGPPFSYSYVGFQGEMLPSVHVSTPNQHTSTTGWVLTADYRLGLRLGISCVKWHPSSNEKNIRLNSMNICGVSYSMTRREQLSELILQPSEVRNAVMGYSVMSLTLRWSYQRY